MTIVILEPAQVELEEAVAFYEAHADGLGTRFLEEFLRAVHLIQAHPAAWHPLGENTRRCRLTRFPCGVVYAVAEAEVVVVAVSHLHRHPNYWLGRLTADEP